MTSQPFINPVAPHSEVVEEVIDAPASPTSPVSAASPASPDSPDSPASPASPAEHDEDSADRYEQTIDGTPETLGFPVQDGERRRDLDDAVAEESSRLYDNES